MNIEPASLPQVQKGRGGRITFIDNDALDIAKQLKEISSDLRLAWNEIGEYFVVYQILDNGDEHLVLTALECDQRIIQRLRLITSESYDYTEELDKVDDEREQELDHQLEEQAGELGEKLYHAIQKDQGTKPRIYLPRSIHES